MSNENSLLDEAAKSLERMQKFDTSILPREKELGESLTFREAVKPAGRLVSLYKRLSSAALEDLSQNALAQVKDKSNEDWALLNTALSFSPSHGNPSTERNNIISKIKSAYDSSFQTLHPYISYSLHRSADFSRLDSEARATMQDIKDRAEIFENQMENNKQEAENILADIRNVAAERGVTQQAIYFKEEADYHECESKKWGTRTVILSIILAIYSMSSIFIHKISYLSPITTYDAIQLSISKILIFSVIAYMLFWAVRNYISHKHNAIVNRHRQNALMTHKALIEAASDIRIREAIMIQAASCIFSPQASGYTFGKGESDNFGPKSVVEILTKASGKDE